MTKLNKGLHRARQIETERAALIERLIQYGVSFDADQNETSIRRGLRYFRQQLAEYHTNCTRAHQYGCGQNAQK